MEVIGPGQSNPISGQNENRLMTAVNSSYNINSKKRVNLLERMYNGRCGTCLRMKRKMIFAGCRSERSGGGAGLSTLGIDAPLDEAKPGQTTAHTGLAEGQGFPLRFPGDLPVEDLDFLPIPCARETLMTVDFTMYVGRRCGFGTAQL